MRPTAAVLVLFSADIGVVSAKSEPSVLVTVRADQMRTHAGQVSFPGGRSELGETVQQTALRETWEEVGIAPSDIQLIDTMPPRIAPRTGSGVVPVIGYLRPEAGRAGEASYPLQLNSAEVASAHWLSIADLAQPDHRGTWQRGTRTGPGFCVEELMIWGFTAQVLSDVLDKYNYSRPWDTTRLLKIPPRFDVR